MDNAHFQKVFETAVKSMAELLDVKGGEYAGSVDRLANFKRGAALTGVSPLQVAFIYASKHYDAIATFVRNDSSGVVYQQSEPIDGRLHDLMNYCLLMLAIIEETRVPTPTADARYMPAGSNVPRS